MEIIDPSEEFKPIDSERFTVLISLVQRMEELATDETITYDIRQELGIFAHQFAVLMSQAMAGYELYKAVYDLALRLYADLATQTYELGVTTRPESLADFEQLLLASHATEA
jgi:hypothetical protein